MDKLGKVICILFAYKKDMNSGVNVFSSGNQRMLERTFIGFVQKWHFG